jgi:hypothetical protein
MVSWIRKTKEPRADPIQELAVQIQQLRIPNYDPADDTERARKWLAKLQTYQKKKGIPPKFGELVNEMVHATAEITTEIAVKTPDQEDDGPGPKKPSNDWPDEWDYEYTEKWIEEFLVKCRKL